MVVTIQFPAQVGAANVYKSGKNIVVAIGWSISFVDCVTGK